MGVEWGGKGCHATSVTLEALLSPLRRGVAAMRYSVIRFGDGPLEFEGEMIAHVSTVDDEPGQQRWQEIRIYKTDEGEYVTEVVGRSIVEGETDLIKVRRYTNPRRVRNGLLRTNREGEQFMTAACHQALLQAHEADPTIL